jgi:glycosyltransferase involved in cell wall biosynthesis
MTKKKGILILTPFFSPNIGGVESHLDDLVAALDEQGYLVFVQTYSPLTTDNTLSKKVEHLGNNTQINRHKWIGKNLFHKLANHPVLDFLYLTPYLFLRSFLFMTANSKKIETIHAQGLNAGLIGVFLKVIFRKRLLISLHAYYAQIEKNRLVARLARLIVNKADFIFGVSNVVINQFKKLKIKKSNIAKYHSWIDINRFKPMDKKDARNITKIEHHFTILFVGRLIPIKGVSLLVDIAKELQFAQFVFIGNGPLDDFLIKSSKKNLNVNFLGQVQNIDMPVYYNSADILCFPSLYEEGLGRVSMEAVACGTPVVASNLGGISETVNEDISILVKPTHDNLKNALITLYQDAGRLKKMSSFCRKYALKNYSKNNADHITKHYYP